MSRQSGGTLSRALTPLLTTDVCAQSRNRVRLANESDMVACSLQDLFWAVAEDLSLADSKILRVYSGAHFCRCLRFPACTLATDCRLRYSTAAGIIMGFVETLTKEHWTKASEARRHSPASQSGPNVAPYRPPSHPPKHKGQRNRNTHVDQTGNKH